MPLPHGGDAQQKACSSWPTRGTSVVIGDLTLCFPSGMLAADPCCPICAAIPSFLLLQLQMCHKAESNREMRGSKKCFQNYGTKCRFTDFLKTRPLWLQNGRRCSEATFIWSQKKGKAALGLLISIDFLIRFHILKGLHI